MFSLRKPGKAFTVETSTETGSSSSSDESASLKSRTFTIDSGGVLWHTVSFPSVPRIIGCGNPFEAGNVIWQSVALQSLLRNTRNCVMRQCRARRWASSEPPAKPAKHVGYRSILHQSINRRNALSALAAKLEEASSETSETSERRPRMRCLIGRVPRRGVGVSLTVRKPRKTVATDEEEGDSSEQEGENSSEQQQEEEAAWQEAAYASTVESVYSMLPIRTKHKKSYQAKHNGHIEDLSCGPCESKKNVQNSIAFHWAEALNRLDREQKKIAKKAINAVLLEAELGNLDKHSVHINSPLVITSSSGTHQPTSCSSHTQTLSPKCSHTSITSQPSPSPPSSLAPSSSSSSCKTSTSCPICSHSTILFRPAACCQKPHTPCRRSHTSLLPLPAPNCAPSQPLPSLPASCPCGPDLQSPHLQTPMIPMLGPPCSNTSIKTPATLCECPRNTAKATVPTCEISISPCPPCSLEPPSKFECPSKADKQLTAPSLACGSSPTGSQNVVKFSPSSFTHPSQTREISPSLTPQCSPSPCSIDCPALNPLCSSHTLVDFPSPTCSCSSDSITHTLAKFSPVPSPCPSSERLQELHSPLPSSRLSPKCSLTGTAPKSPCLLQPNNSSASLASCASPDLSSLDERIRKILRFPDVDASSVFHITCKKRKCHNPTTKLYLKRFNRYIFRGLNFSRET